MHRTAFAFRVVLLLAVTLVSVLTAMGKAQTRDGWLVELCNDAGIAAVRLDANGDPVKPVHVCPDCVLAGLALPGLPASLGLPDRTEARLFPQAPGKSVGLALLPTPFARGPPAPVPA